MRDRAERMLLGDGERPRPSGDAPVAGGCTAGLILDVRTVINELWRARRSEIIAACHPTQIDEMDALAWVLTDVLRGGALLHPSVTNGLGKRVDSKAKSIQKEITAEKQRTANALRAAKRRAEKH